MKVADKNVVVTGAGSGIGRSLVLELVKRGAKVAAWDINEQSLAETKALAPGVETFVVDIANRAAVEAAAHQVGERLGAVDGVINCAGIIQPFVDFEVLKDADLDRVFAVNWTGTLNTTRVFLPELKRRPSAHLVNISSMGGFLPVPGQTIYGASKAAVKLFTEGLHAELANTNVRVTVVFPGAVATNITKNSGLATPTDGAAQKITQPDDAARQIIDGMERDAYRVLVGRDAKVLDVLYRVNPQRAVAFVAKMIRKMMPASTS